MLWARVRAYVTCVCMHVRGRARGAGDAESTAPRAFLFQGGQTPSHLYCYGRRREGNSRAHRASRLYPLLAWALWPLEQAPGSGLASFPGGILLPQLISLSCLQLASLGVETNNEPPSSQSTSPPPSKHLKMIVWPRAREAMLFSKLQGNIPWLINFITLRPEAPSSLPQGA